MRHYGIETRPLRQMTGEAEFDSILHRCFIPRKPLLGPLNGGWHVGMDVLTENCGGRSHNHAAKTR